MSRDGAAPLSTTLDHVGPLTRHVGDAAAVLDAISGRDNGDPTTMRQDVGSVSAHLDEGVSKLRIGLLSASPTEVEEPLIAKAVECAASGLTDLGASVREIDISWLAEARYVGGILTAVEAAEFHRDLVHENPSRLHSRAARQSGARAQK